MDVFGSALAAGRAGLWQAALHAAHELGVFSALARGPRPLPDLAAATAVAPRRLRALLDVLALEGALRRAPDGRWALAAPPPAPPTPPPEGWGRLAEVLRADRPLDPEAAFADAGEARARFHRHLAEAGAGPARALMDLLAADHGDDAALLDLGAGLGTYAAAWLAGGPRRRATLVDRAPVLALAAAHLGAADAAGKRARLLPGDLLDAELDVGASHDVALLCNVLHLLSPEDCARLVARAAAALRPGGEVVVKDLLVHSDRGGPAVGVYFALNMALYTQGGDVYDEAQVRAWLAAAGLRAQRAELPGLPDALVLRGVRAATPQPGP